jgi:hypothetical protein
VSESKTSPVTDMIVTDEVDSALTAGVSIETVVAELQSPQEVLKLCRSGYLTCTEASLKSRVDAARWLALGHSTALSLNISPLSWCRDFGVSKSTMYRNLRLIEIWQRYSGDEEKLAAIDSLNKNAFWLLMDAPIQHAEEALKILSGKQTDASKRQLIEVLKRAREKTTGGDLFDAVAEQVLLSKEQESASERAIKELEARAQSATEESAALAKTLSEREQTIKALEEDYERERERADQAARTNAAPPPSKPNKTDDEIKRRKDEIAALQKKQEEESAKLRRLQSQTRTVTDLYTSMREFEASVTHGAVMEAMECLPAGERKPFIDLVNGTFKHITRIHDAVVKFKG